MKRKDIIDAWTRIRKIDSTIPDEVLDFMKNASIEKLEENKIAFFVYDHGDPSVGINPASTKISIDTDLTLDQETIEEVFKPCIAEMLDVPVKQVLTEEEFNAEQKEIREWERTIDQYEREVEDSEDHNLDIY